MTSGIIPTPQAQTPPVADLSQQPGKQNYALTLPQQAQDKYLTNNQLIPVGGNNTQKPHLSAGLFSALAGGITTVASFCLLKILNYISGKIAHKKASNTVIGIFSLAFGVTSAALQWRAVKKYNDSRNTNQSTPLKK